MYRVLPRKKLDTYAFLVILLSIGCTVLYFYPVIGHLNTSLFNIGGDCLKNYYNYLYFIKYDTGHEFSGMGYPFREHLIFTDNMPALAAALSKLKILFPGIADYSLLIIHLLILSSFTIGCWYIYKTLRYWKAGKGWSVFSALFIIYFSPQVLRADAHFGLAVVCYFPMLIYWLIRYDKEHRILFLVCISALTLLFSFIHVYHLGFTLILLVCYLFSHLIVKRVSLKEKLLNIVQIILTATAPIIVFKLYLSLTDDVGDRPKFPPGFLEGTTSLKQIFTSTHSPLGYVFQFLFGNRPSEGGEGYVYPGFLAIIFAFALIIILLRNVIVKKKFNHPVPTYSIWLLTALLGLLAGMGVPFIWGLESVTEHLSSFRQLRSLGRFSWIFYYLLTIYIAIWTSRIYCYLRENKSKGVAATFAFALAAVSIVQLSGYACRTSSALSISKKNYEIFFSKNGGSQHSIPWLKQHGQSPSMFQSIIALPFFHVGSDKISISSECTDDEMRSAFRIALQTHLPVVNVMMSRTLWERSFGIVSLFDGPFSKKSFIEAFNDKPVLLIVNTKCPLTTGEAQLLQYSDYIGTLEGDELYSFHLKKMIASYEKITDSVKNIISRQEKREGLLNAEDFFYVDHFDKNRQKPSFSGKGAVTNLLADTAIARIVLPRCDTDRNYILSVWSLCDSINDRLNYFKIRQYDDLDKLIDENDMLTKKSTLIDRFWFKAEKTIRIKKNADRIEIIASSVYKNGSYCLAIDELALWPEGKIYFSKADDETLLINNRPIFSAR